MRRTQVHAPPMGAHAKGELGGTRGSGAGANEEDALKCGGGDGSRKSDHADKSTGSQEIGECCARTSVGIRSLRSPCARDPP